jgi:signal transduction histidine kinase
MLASGVIERKLPTLNLKRFSESTCDALLGIVLRESSTLQRTDQVALQQLADQDAAFAQWLAEMPAGGRVSNWLVSNAHWREDTLTSERLWQLANVSVRLQTLEQRYVDELATEKRKAIYHFAYGLSHELNNPLANIATRAGVLMHGEPGEGRRQMLETIIDNAMRGSEMLGDLMLLARPPEINPQTTNLSNWFESFVGRCSTWATKRNLKIDSQGEPPSQTASFDPVAITEAAWCLVRNAFEASRENDSIQIRLDESDGQVQLGIYDFGRGLSREALQSCFDPYYSGREAGRGLGLGLAKAQLIATLHGGSLSVDNRPGGGCAAILSWPV